MRILFFLLILLFSIQVNAQKPEIVTINTTERILDGDIGDKLPITVYVKAVQRSENVGYVFSVSGWYKYDKVGIPIPFAGIWGSGVHLFVSKDKELLKDIEDFKIKKGTESKRLDHYLYKLEELTKDNSKITERFHLEFEEHRISGRWKSRSKDLWVALNSSSSTLYNTTNYLKLPNGSYFDLSNLDVPSRTNFTIEAAVNNGQNIILGYSYHANLNYGGRCGGGTNSGKIALAFDKDFKLIATTMAEFEDCYRELTVDDLTKISEQITEYKIEDYSASKQYVYEVNKEKGTIVQKK